MKTKFTIKQLQQIKEFYDQDIGSRKIAEIMNVDRSTIQRAYKQLNLDSATKKTPRYAYKATEKSCKSCKEIKIISEFRQRNRSGLVNYESNCLSCEAKLDNERLKKRAKRLRQTNPNFVIKRSISYSIWKALKNQNSSKNGNSCLNYLSYTIEELKERLEKQFEPWMSWENYGNFNAKIWNDNDQNTWTWNIDHIIPQSDLIYHSMKDENFKKCWSLDNLRPLNAKQNLFEGVLRIRHKAA